jgi:diguanylate cyclase (GGDEF)-like protein
MSMQRQIWLAIMMTAFIAFGGGLVSSVINAKTYLESQLSQKNIDNAHALAISLSQSTPTKANAEAAVNAMFDSGHYEFIEIHDAEDKVITERFSDDGHPKFQYLTKLVHIRPFIGSAEINNGWKQFGTVYVSSNSDFAYSTLHKTIVESCLGMLLAGLLSGLLSYLILSRFTKSLNDVVEQVSASSKRNFFTLPETSVPELSKLTTTVNNTMHRLKEAFDHEAHKLENMRKKACSDPLTGVANREFFLSILENATQQAMKQGGVLVLVRINDLPCINQQLGRAQADALILAITNTLNSYTIGIKEAFTGRLNGSDFAVLMPNSASKDDALSHLILKDIHQVAKKWLAQEAHIIVGATAFKFEDKVNEVLTKADEVLRNTQR